MKYGTKVRVTSGFYEGMEGIVQKYNDGKLRVIFGITHTGLHCPLITESNLEIIN